ACADREVALAQRREQVRDRLQRSDHPCARRGCKAQPARQDHERERPLDLRRLSVTQPEEAERRRHGRETRQQCCEENLLLVGEATAFAGHRSWPQGGRRTLQRRAAPACALESVFFEAAIKGAAAEAEFLGGAAGVAVAA